MARFPRPSTFSNAFSLGKNYSTTFAQNCQNTLCFPLDDITFPSQPAGPNNISYYMRMSVIRDLSGGTNSYPTMPKAEWDISWSSPTNLVLYYHSTMTDTVA